MPDPVMEGYGTEGTRAWFDSETEIDELSSVVLVRSMGLLYTPTLATD